MTKKDFEIIASIIHRLDIDADTRTKVALAFANRLEESYLRFHKAKFIKASLQPSIKAVNP